MTAATVSTEAPTLPAAEPDRRFYAFTLDRLAAWGVDLLVVYVVHRTLVADGHVWTGVAVVVAAALLVGLAFAVPLGLRGTSPGRAALGLRVVAEDSGAPIGVRRALLRTFVLGVCSLPTFGIGVASLAWTAVTDPAGRRRGWHDLRSGSVVVDARPAPVAVDEPPEAPRPIVNLTAMRLVPASAVPPPQGPRTSSPASEAAPPAALTPASAVAIPAATPPRTGASLGSPLRPPAADAGPERPAVRHGPASAPARWRVSFDTGESVPVDGLTLLGRRPEPRQGEPVTRLVPLVSTDMSLSKTHALLQVTPDGALVVTDRGSTNGSVLVRGGVSRDLPAGRPTTLLPGDLVRLGDRRMTVARES